MTVHKRQGSEYLVVILPLFLLHYLLLSRNLAYTGLTQAKKLSIMIGSIMAIGISIKRMTDRQRYTVWPIANEVYRTLFPIKGAKTQTESLHIMYGD